MKDYMTFLTECVDRSSGEEQRRTDQTISWLTRRTFLAQVGLCLGSTISCRSEHHQQPPSFPPSSLKNCGTLFQDKSPNEQRRLIEEARTFIQLEKRPVTEALCAIMNNGAKCILVGESHSTECVHQRQSVTQSLRELQKIGLTHLGIEADQNVKDDRLNQEKIDAIDPGAPNGHAILHTIHPLGKPDQRGIDDMVLEAKRLGVRIVLLDRADLRRREFQLENLRMDDSRVFHQQVRMWADAKNARDEQMQSRIDEELSPSDKMLIYIGDEHVQKRKLADYQGYPFQRIGYRLLQKFGRGVVSVRCIGSVSCGFDGESGESTSQAPIVLDLFDIHDPLVRHEVIILPDRGPMRGHSVTKSADYVIMGGYFSRSSAPE